MTRRATAAALSACLSTLACRGARVEQPAAPVAASRVAAPPAPAVTAPPPATQVQLVAPPPLVRCAEEGWIEVPAPWNDLRMRVVFAKHGTRKLEPLDPVQWRSLVELLRARRDLVVALTGSRYARERPGLDRRRQEAVRGDLHALGIAADQVWLTHPPERDGAAVSVRVLPRPADAVALNEPCGTTVVDLPGSDLARGLESVGWWAREHDRLDSSVAVIGVRTPRGDPLEPLRGSRLTPLVRLDDGYAAPRWLATRDVIEVVVTDLDGRRPRSQALPITPNAGVVALGLAAHADGIVMAWSQGRELHTVTLDQTGAPTRPPSRELVVDRGIHELSLDMRLGAGGIAVSEVDPDAGYATLVHYVALGSDGHVRGTPTALADTPWVSASSAVATLAADRVAVLIGTCAPYTMRFDLDGAGQLLAIDRRFIRNPLRPGVAVGLRGNRLWAASIGGETADLRPFCEAPAGSDSGAPVVPQDAPPRSP